ncbi:hypothetical protein [Opitutus terrae]|uniref:Uncharacterized protein n=1 Tax=Opitutus terrae (strain DSM 11246 / JCM 15787 / PB90-1) TaxID=452637 RepID=B1ZUS2_OPITP|nr:hypothetical protein [Opitutus terrae]ACB74956.1 hypothetical protein Oter_1672 [Opitutus terrae PB90-1]
MELDVRIPIGWLFLLLGLILVIYGFASDPAIYARHSLGQNVNLIWGTVFAIFGGFVLFLAKRKKR